MEDDEVLENFSVLIAGSQIEAVGDADSMDLSGDVEVIDISDHYLMPGFSDMHVHNWHEEDYPLFLANGVLRIRNMWGAQEHLDKRELIARGEMTGPEIFTAGPLMDGPGAAWPDTTVPEHPDEVASLVKGLKEQGFDYLKVYDGLSEEVFTAVLKAGAENNMPVIGHVPKAVALNRALKAGMSSVEHVSGYPPLDGSDSEPDSFVKEFVHNDAWSCPTLAVLHRIEHIETYQKGEFPLKKYVRPELIKWWESGENWPLHYEEKKAFVRELHKAGAGIVSGADNGNPYVIAGFTLHDELTLLKECGLSAYEVLLTTTVNSAKMLGILHRSGTITVGKDADLVILKKNPLKDIAHTRTLSGIILKGIYYGETALKEMLKEAEEFVASLEVPEKSSP